MSRVSSWARSNKLVAFLTAGAVLLAVGAVAFLDVAKATDQPTFCGSACHEMTPYHTAWSQGAHRNVACVDCHVGPGAERLTHKVVALQEVLAHFRADTSFPRLIRPQIPDARCIACHTNVAVTATGFDHAAHAKRGPCVSCHARAGHDVPVSALKEAGIYNPTTAVATASADTTLAVVDAGAADLNGHVAVMCSRCHTMSKTVCSACHTPPHKPRGECSQCHAPGPKFVFAHPDSSADCASCHNRPTPHPSGADCASCHDQVGTSWMHTHTAGSDCATCHARPAQHRDGACATCHTQPGVTWTFSHPGIGADCASCHTPPANHHDGVCATCHKQPGVKWAFSHPGIGADCASCHTPPANMPAGQCSNCHRQPGVSWAFAHAAIPGGKHTSQSFACANCHPNGYTTHTCIGCHDSAGGGN